MGTIAAGFLAFWPVGLLGLFWKMKKGELWKGSADGAAPWSVLKGQGNSMCNGFRSWKSAKGQWSASGPWKAMNDAMGGNSGNHAFEEYKAAELAKIDEMRRKLEDDQKAFAGFMDRVRRAKDKEEFDRFMAERNAPEAPEAPPAS